MKLKDYLIKYRFRRKDLAKTFGCSVSHITNLIKGKTTPSAKLMIAITSATKGKVQPNDFFLPYSSDCSSPSPTPSTPDNSQSLEVLNG